MSEPLHARPRSTLARDRLQVFPRACSTAYVGVALVHLPHGLGRGRLGACSTSLTFDHSPGSFAAARGRRIAVFFSLARWPPLPAAGKPSSQAMPVAWAALAAARVVAQAAVQAAEVLQAALAVAWMGLPSPRQDRPRATNRRTTRATGTAFFATTSDGTVMAPSTHNVWLAQETEPRVLIGTRGRPPWVFRLSRVTSCARTTTPPHGIANRMVRGRATGARSSLLRSKPTRRS